MAAKSGLTLTSTQLRTVFLGFREVAEFYCTSDESEARDARKETRLTAFHPKLLQNLDALCIFLPSQIDKALHLNQDVEDDIDLGDEIRGLCNALEKCIKTDAYNDPDASELEESCKQHAKLFRMAQDIQAAMVDVAAVQEKDRAKLRASIRLSGRSTRLRDKMVDTTKQILAGLLQCFPRPNDDRSELRRHDRWAERRSAAISNHWSQLHDMHLKDWACNCYDRHFSAHAAFHLRAGTAEFAYQLVVCPEGSPDTPWRAANLMLMPGSSLTSETSDVSDLHTAMDLHQEDNSCFFFNRGSLISAQRPIADDTGPFKLISLRQCLANSEVTGFSRTSRVDRIALATILSHAFLCLGGGPWWPYKNPEVEVYLMQAEGSATLNLLQPFLLASLDPDNQIQPELLISAMNFAMPALPVLGKLILELVVARQLSWEQAHFEFGKFAAGPDGCSGTLAAIENCMGLNMDQTFKRGPIRGSNELRHEFINRVINSLNYDIVEGFKSSLEDMLEEQTKISRNRQAARRRSPKAMKIMCFDDEHKSETVAEEDRNAARNWMNELQSVHEIVNRYPIRDRAIRVAVLDTGAQFGGRYLMTCGLKDRLRECRTWLGCSSLQDGTRLEDFVDMDEDGHGTHSASALNEVAPICDIYIGQVFPGRGSKTGSEVDPLIAEGVAKAIRYAVDVWEVDIISMSFGFSKKTEAIADALRHAHRQHVLMFAAAANWGALRAISWPATDPHVICAFALSGDGNQYRNNPSPGNKFNHFAALGICMPVYSKAGLDGQSKLVYRSGSSLAAPVAAGVAALLLHIALNGIALPRCEGAVRSLKDPTRMSLLLDKMQEQRSDYRFLVPWKFIKDYSNIGDNYLVYQIHDVADAP